MNKLDAFHRKCMMKILKVSGQTKYETRNCTVRPAPKDPKMEMDWAHLTAITRIVLTWAPDGKTRQGTQ